MCYLNCGKHNKKENIWGIGWHFKVFCNYIIALIFRARLFVTRQPKQRHLILILLKAILLLTSPVPDCTATPSKNPGEADLTGVFGQCLEENSICYGPVNQRDFLHGLSIQVIFFFLTFSCKYILVYKCHVTYSAGHKKRTLVKRY
jgi:hypothetical protein